MQYPFSENMASHYPFGSYIPSTLEKLLVTHHLSSVSWQGEEESDISFFPRSEKGIDLPQVMEWQW